MWSPTHIQVTVQRAKGLLVKGKNGTNNCFVTIGLGKEKYQTSVKDKAEPNVNWNEECELKIPDQGNRAELVLTCLHRNNLGIDEFLGQVTLPLNEMDVYDRPRSKWFKLESKPGKEKKNKERGELEVRVSFIVKSGSLTDLSKNEKHKSSVGKLAASVGGSLLSIGTIEKRKGIKKFAKSIGSKMHLNGKKKNKDGGDDTSSFSGSFASIGTPNSSNGVGRHRGQRAGEADPGVISEDEDEFVFDNLSHKSSGSSLNIRSGLHPPSQNFVPHTPSPLLGQSKKGGKPQLPLRNVEDDYIDPELEQIENDFSIRARTLPPPSKPPRAPTLGGEVTPEAAKNDQTLDEWESKLYGSKGNSDSLKRRSWEPARVPLTSPPEEEEIVAIEPISTIQAEVKEIKEIVVDKLKTPPVNPFKDEGSSSSSSDSELEIQAPMPKEEHLFEQKTSPKKPEGLKLNLLPKVNSSGNLLSPDVNENDFEQFNASFAKYEQQNSAKFFDLDADKKWTTQDFIKKESQVPAVIPVPKPRNHEKEEALKQAQKEQEEKLQIQKKAEEERLLKLKEEERKLKDKLQAEEKQRQEEEQRIQEEEIARLEKLRQNEQKLRDEEQAKQNELRKRQEEQKRRELKRLEEDQRILSFAKRSISVEEEELSSSTPEQSPESKEKRIGKFKYSNKRDKIEDHSNSSSPKSTERIIIGHERSSTQAERRSEISAALAKKYEGKSREELMLIANGMENEALLQRQRVKELEDYLDNLLLRVMETHPKILQNPYARTTSAKSFKNYINMNDFL